MTEEAMLWQALARQETARHAERLAAAVQQEVLHLQGTLTAQPRLSQVRNLGRVLAPQGAGDTTAQRLARLHDLAASQLRRTLKREAPMHGAGSLLPAALNRLSPQEEGLPPTFWGYVAARLQGLRSGNQARPGAVEQVWLTICQRYNHLDLPATPPPATVEEIHLQLAETFVYYCCETWEYREPEGGRA